MKFKLFSHLNRAIIVEIFPNRLFKSLNPAINRYVKKLILFGFEGERANIWIVYLLNMTTHLDIFSSKKSPTLGKAGHIKTKLIHGESDHYHIILM
jgi:hypothetical protein